MAKTKSVFEIIPNRDNDKGVFVAEQVLAVLHDTLDSAWFSRAPEFTWELASVSGAIRFFFSCPPEHREFAVQQMYAHFPGVQIEEVAEDYVNDAPNGLAGGDEIRVKGEKRSETYASGTASEQRSHERGVRAPRKSATVAELGLEKFTYLPLKTYTQFSEKTEENVIDPYASVTAALGRQPEVDKVVRVAFSPLPDRSWKGPWAVRVAAAHWPQWLKGLLAGPRSWWIRTAAWPLVAGARFVAFFIQAPPEESASKPDAKDKVSKSVEQKLAGFGWGVRVQIAAFGLPRAQALPVVKDLARSLHIYSASDTNSFRVRRVRQDRKGRFMKDRSAGNAVLNSAELAGLAHVPTPYVRTPGITWITCKTLQPPPNLPLLETEGADLAPIGATWFRGQKTAFGLRPDDRRRHVYAVGKTGMGKSTLLETMIRHDMNQGRGLAVIDPHGDLAEATLAALPTWRTNDVILLDPGDQEWPVGVNMLESVHRDLRPIVASGLVGIFKKMFADSWGPRLEYILRNTVLTLLQVPGSTLLEIPVLLTDWKFREKTIAKLDDPLLVRFWKDEFAKFSPNQLSEATSPILNKVGQFLSSHLLRNIVGQRKNAFSFRWAMDKKKIVIVNLSKGRIGEDASHLLGSMIVTKFQIDAMSRADVPEKDRGDFYLYVDEFQNFATDSFATILSEARKYRLNLTMANQYVAQMPEAVRDAVFGNVGTTVAFQVGLDDAEPLMRAFGGEDVLAESDLMNLPKYSIYTKLLVNGMPTETFSARTLPPLPPLADAAQTREKIMKVTRAKYAVEREKVETEINGRHPPRPDKKEDDAKASKGVKH